MKVLLISSNRVVVPYPVYPLSLDYVAGALKDEHDILLIDVNHTGIEDDFIKGITAFDPDIVGFSIRNVDSTDILEPDGYIDKYRQIIEKVRSCISAPIVLGGSGFTIFPLEMMHALDADYGIIGEGEKFSYFLQALEKNENPGNIEGIIRKDGNYTMPEPWKGVLKRDFDPRQSHTDFYIKKGGMLNLQTKRGCPFKCIYCTYPGIEGSTLRLIDPEEVAATALDLQRAGAKYFFITDSAFNSHYDHSMAVAREFIRAGISIPWGAFFAPSKPPEGYYRLMKEAGLSHVEFGTESLSNRVLPEYKKPFKVKDVIKAHNDAVGADLHVAHYLLLGGPGETMDTLKETIAHVSQLKKTVVFFFCGMRIYPQTPLYDRALSEGQIAEGQNILEPVYYQSPHISKDEILAYIESKMDNRPNWVVGSGGKGIAKFIRRMHRRGAVGPLWENIIQ